jgi:hypothetical protein
MAVFIKGKTFTSTEQVTSTKLHQLVDSGTFDTGAVDGVTTALSGGAIIVKDAGITGAKLSPTVAIPTGATAVTQAVDTNTTSIATTAFAKAEADVAETAAKAFAIQRGNHTGTQAVGTITGLGALATTGTAAQICKAWCNFNGTLTGTNAPRSGFNVSSVTRNGAGDYTINFSSALSSTDYATIVSARRAATNSNMWATISQGGIYSTTQVQIETITSTPSNSDSDIVCVSVFSN